MPTVLPNNYVLTEVLNNQRIDDATRTRSGTPGRAESRRAASGDLADALASYWILNWMMATGQDDNRVQTLAVGEQVRGTIAGSPAHTGFGNRRRQELAEIMMLDFLVQQATYGDAVRRHDGATMQRLGDAAQRRFRTEMGLDLRGLALTEAGFAPARQAG